MVRPRQRPGLSPASSANGSVPAGGSDEASWAVKAMNPERWKRIDQIFQQALSQPPANRESFLDRVCGGDEDLRREVESRLEHGRQAEGFIVLAEDHATGLVSNNPTELPQSFASGDRLGPYEIVALLGAGGMGEVYRAKDLRLQRTVAIKVLRHRTKTGPEYRQRFEREGRAISSLNHPHICQLYDVGDYDGAGYIVMEYLDGQTLAQRLKQGPLPLEEALRYAIQIAGALDRAHRNGIVHRDLKPANIMLTEHGAKLLDFGLARRVEFRPAVDEESGVGTLTTDLTGKGSIVGTVPYMAPEQLEGKEADARTDIFALGAVLYEMLTGKRAFEGQNQASLISAIMTSDPPAVSASLPLATPFLDHIVRTCLMKNREQRWSSALDVMIELQWAGSILKSAPVPYVRERRWPWAVLLGIAALVIAWLAWPGGDSEDATVYQIPVLPPQDVAFSFGPAGGGMALSPNGKTLAFVGVKSDVPLLWIMPLDTHQARALTGTENASLPFWSPDSLTVAFFADRKLKKISLSGGPSQIICDAPTGRGGSWGENGMIAFTPRLLSPVHKVSENGGTPVPPQLWIRPARRMRITGRSSYRARAASSTSREALTPQKSSIFLGSVDESIPDRRPLLAANSKAIYVRASKSGVFGRRLGHLVFLRGGSLMAQSLDEHKFVAVGEPVAVADQVAFEGNTGKANFSASPNRILAYGSFRLRGRTADMG